MANESPRDLPAAVREFFRHFSPRVLSVWLIVTVVTRLFVGQWQWWNLAVVVAVIVIQPFFEWTFHVFVLHARPRQLGNREFDTIVAQDHRRHHADPRFIPLIFIPRRWVGYLVLGASVVALLVPGGWGNKATAWMVLAVAALGYEWTHYLIHTDYKPKSRIYRHTYASHRLHHYRNEKYWFGVTSDLGDRVLGTAPKKDDVPVSRTARDIIGSGATR